MKCFQCNAELPEDSQFCSFCGAQQPAAPTAPEETPLPTQTELTPEDAAVYTPDPCAEAGQPPLDAVQPADAGVDAEAPTQMGDIPQKKSKKGLIIGLVAGFAVLVIGAVIAALLLGGDPLARAFVGTQNALQQMTQRSSNLNTMSENLNDLIESDDVTLIYSLDMQQTGYDGTDAAIRAELQLNSDKAAALEDGSLTLNIDYQGQSADGTVHFSADNEKLLLSLDGIDEVYGVEMEALWDALEIDDPSDSSYTLHLKPLDELTADDLKNGPVKEVFETVESSREGQTRIETDGGEKICAHYVLRWDADAVEDCFDRFSNDPTALFDDEETTTETLVSLVLVSLMQELEPSVDIYVCQDRIVGLDLRGSGDSDTIFVRLLGKDNVWEHVRVSSTDSETVDLYWDNDGNLSLCLTENGSEQELFRYDDGTGRFTFNLQMLSDSAVFDGKLRGENDGAEISIHIADYDYYGLDLSLSLSMLPLQQQPKMLSDHYTDLSRLSEEEAQALAFEALRQLGLDKLYGLIDGGAGYDYDDEPVATEPPDPDTEPVPTAAENDPALSEDALCGSYTLKYANYEGITIDYEDLGMGDFMSLTLSSGGIGILTAEDESAEINWSFDGETVYLVEDGVAFMELRCEGGNLIYTESGMDMVFVR